MTNSITDAPSARRGSRREEKLYNIKSDHARAWLMAMQHQGLDLDAITPMQSKALKKVHRVPAMMMIQPPKISPLIARTPTSVPSHVNNRKKKPGAGERLDPLPKPGASGSGEEDGNEDLAGQAQARKGSLLRTNGLEEPAVGVMIGGSAPATLKGAPPRLLSNLPGAKKKGDPKPGAKPSAKPAKHPKRTDPLGAQAPRPRGPLTPIRPPPAPPGSSSSTDTTIDPSPLSTPARIDPNQQQQTPPVSETKPTQPVVARSLYGGLSDKWRNERRAREDEMRGFMKKMGLDPQQIQQQLTPMSTSAAPPPPPLPVPLEVKQQTRAIESVPTETPRTRPEMGQLAKLGNQLRRPTLNEELASELSAYEREARTGIEMDQLLKRQNLAISESQSRMKNGLQRLEIESRALLIREEMDWRTQLRRDFVVETDKRKQNQQKRTLEQPLYHPVSFAGSPETVGVSIRAMLGVIEAQFASIRHQLAAQEHAQRTALTALFMLPPAPKPTEHPAPKGRKTDSSSSSVTFSSSFTSSRSLGKNQPIPSTTNTVDTSAIMQRVVMILSMAETVDRAAVASEWERTVEAARFAWDHGLQAGLAPPVDENERDEAEENAYANESFESSPHTPLGSPPAHISKPSATITTSTVTASKPLPSLGEKYSCIIIQKWVRGWLTRLRVNRVRALWRIRASSFQLAPEFDAKKVPPTPLIVGVAYEDEWDNDGKCFLEPVSRKLYVDESSLLDSSSGGS